MKQIHEITNVNKIGKIFNSHMQNGGRNNCHICKYYKKTFENDEIPKYANLNQIRRNKSTKTLTKIFELEERILALRFPFLQIE